MFCLQTSQSRRELFFHVFKHDEIQLEFLYSELIGVKSGDFCGTASVNMERENDSLFDSRDPASRTVKGSVCIISVVFEEIIQGFSSAVTMRLGVPPQESERRSTKSFLVIIIIFTILFQ